MPFVRKPTMAEPPERAPPKLCPMPWMAAAPSIAIDLLLDGISRAYGVLRTRASRERIELARRSSPPESPPQARAWRRHGPSGPRPPPPTPSPTGPRMQRVHSRHFRHVLLIVAACIHLWRRAPARS